MLLTAGWTKTSSTSCRVLILQRNIRIYYRFNRDRKSQLVTALGYQACWDYVNTVKFIRQLKLAKPKDLAG
jgi:hypothetical protein